MGPALERIERNGTGGLQREGETREEARRRVYWTERLFWIESGTETEGTSHAH